MPIPKRPDTHETPARVLLRDTVRERLRNAIMDGTFEPGEVLHDKEIQEWLGVSRTPVRDALNELARAGLVEMEPNRYTRVANPSDEHTTSAMRTLGVIYAGVVRLAIPRLDSRTSSRIAGQLDLFTAAIRAGDPLEMRRLGFPTFQLFEAECDNPLLVKLCRESVDGLAYKVRSQKVLEMYNTEQTVAALGRLAEATRGGDAVAGAEAVLAVFQFPEA